MSHLTLNHHNSPTMSHLTLNHHNSHQTISCLTLNHPKSLIRRHIGVQNACEKPVHLLGLHLRPQEQAGVRGRAPPVSMAQAAQLHENRPQMSPTGPHTMSYTSVTGTPESVCYSRQDNAQC